MTADKVKSVDDMRQLIEESARSGPREYTAAQAKAIADQAVIIFNRNPEPEDVKLRQFVAGWQAAERHYEQK